MPPKVVSPRSVAASSGGAARKGSPKTFAAPSSARKAVRTGSAKGRTRAGSSASSSSRGAFSSPKLMADDDSNATTPEEASLHADASQQEQALDIDGLTASTPYFNNNTQDKEEQEDHASSHFAKAASQAQLTLDAQATAALAAAAAMQKPSPPARPPRKLTPRSPQQATTLLPSASLLSPPNGTHAGEHSDDVSAESDDHSDVSFEDARAGDDSVAVTPRSPEQLVKSSPKEEMEESVKQMDELQRQLGFEDISFDEPAEEARQETSKEQQQEDEELKTPAAVVEELPTPKRVSLLSNSQPVSPKSRAIVVDEPLSLEEDAQPAGLVAASGAPPPPLPKRSPSDTPSLIVQPPDSESTDSIPVPISKEDSSTATGLASPSLDLPSPSASPTGPRFTLWQRLRAASVSVDMQGSATSPSSTYAGLGTPPIPEATSASTSPSTVLAHGSTSKPPLISRRPTFGALSSFSTLAAAAAAGISAQAASVRGAYGAQQNVPAERVRLPRYQVDEAKLAEDVMRFADARDVLHTERDVEKLRELGQRLEEGWREKLRETHTMREKLEQAQHSLFDVEDENKHLRSSVSGLSEQIATLEATFHSFQLSTVEQMRMEKQLWDEERREALDITRYEAAQARRELEAAKAVNAQLRLVVLGALKSGGNELQSIDAKLDMLGRSGVGSPDGVAGRRRTDSRGSLRSAGNPRRSSTLTSVTSDEETDVSELGLGLLSPGLTSPGGTTEDGLLFDLPASPDSARPTTMLFDHPVPLAHLKLLGLVPDESTPPPSALSDSPHPGGPDSPGTPTRVPPRSAGPVLSRSSTSASLVSQLSAQKTAADEAHARALREENEALRARLRDTTRSLAETELECQELRTQVRQTEEAVSGLFDQVQL